MPIHERTLRKMAGVATEIAGDRPCRRCGYNLKGLRTGSVCPECGTPIRSATSGRFVNNMVDAPIDYLKRIRLGLGMLSLSVVLGVAAGIATFFTNEPVLALAGLLCAPLWASGTLFVTDPRPIEDNCPPDPILDNARLRLAIRWTQSVCLLSAGLLFAGLVAERLAAVPLGTTPPEYVLWLYGSGLGVLLLSVLMLVPFGVYLSALADWAGHGPVTMQFRVSAIILTLAGGIGLMATIPVVIDPLGSGPTAIIAVWSGILAMIAGSFFLVLVLRLANSARWAVSNARSGMERDARVARRQAREAEQMANRMQAPTVAPKRHMERWESDDTIPLAEKAAQPAQPDSVKPGPNIAQ